MGKTVLLSWDSRIEGVKLFHFLVGWNELTWKCGWRPSESEWPLRQTPPTTTPTLCRSPLSGVGLARFWCIFVPVRGGGGGGWTADDCFHRGRFIVWVVLSRVHPGQTVWRWCSVSLASLFGCWWTNAAVTVAASEKDHKAFQYHVHPRISWTV